MSRGIGWIRSALRHRDRRRPDGGADPGHLPIADLVRVGSRERDVLPEAEVKAKEE